MLVINNLLLDVSPLPAGLYRVLLCMYARLSECMCACVCVCVPVATFARLRLSQGFKGP